MTWECGECHVKEGQDHRVDTACHHCGKLLCWEDRVLIADIAFANKRGDTERTAVHCRSCKRRYHRQDPPLSRGGRT
jgi:hypothetical protein